MNKLAFDIGNTFGSPIGQTGGVGLADLVSLILSNAVAFAGVIMFFFFLGCGLGVIIGAGRNDPQTAEKGKQTVTAAVIGFIIIFVAYWIIQLVEGVTGVNILNPNL